MQMQNLITPLDQIAIPAMIALLNNQEEMKLMRILAFDGQGNGSLTDQVAKIAYDFAESMLAESQKRKEKQKV